MQELDLFGNPVVRKGDLRQEFGANPFTILDTKDGLWQARKRKWKSLGIQSEVGRDATTYNMADWASKKNDIGELPSDTSIFDPTLCEMMYRWFCPTGGKIIDPFAGGSVRGIVANYLGFKYTGIDIRVEQVDSNRKQAMDILDVNNQPRWITGDSNLVLPKLNEEKFDMLLTCPPYADLEVYSDLEGDISNMKYGDFILAFECIMRKACKLLKKEAFAVIVVGEVRDKGGNYYGFVPDTVKLMQRSGMEYYNEAILATSLASAAMRAGGNMKSKKLVKVHQNVLIFKKK